MSPDGTARGKRVHVLTNAHAAGVEIKIARTRIDRYVDRIVNAFEVGHLKTRPEYWPTCQRLIGFDPSRSLYIDDDEACLAAAQPGSARRAAARQALQLVQLDARGE